MQANKLWSLSFLLLLFFYKDSSGQVSGKDQIVASPDVAALAKYINYPISYNTGLTNISIPLYEIKLKDATIPITLSYHASGIKRNDRATNGGSIGYGWTLNAEPVLTRNINHVPDELLHGFLTMNLNVLNQGVAPFFNMEFKNNWGSRYDGRPDVYYFNLLGETGKFLYNRTNFSSTSQLVVHPNRVKVENPINNSSFLLTDSKGIKYSFPSELAVLGWRSDIGLPTSFINWKASQIQTPLNDVVNFSYFPTETIYYNGRLTEYAQVEDEVFEEQDYPNRPFRFAADGTPPSSGMGGSGTPCDASCDPPYDGSASEPTRVPFPMLIKKNQFSIDTYLYYFGEGTWKHIPELNQSVASASNRVDNRTIQQISFPGGKIVFAKTSTKITAINIYNDSNELLKSIKFVNQDNQLKEVQYYDKNNQLIEKYSLDYNYLDNLWIETDFWGYVAQATLGFDEPRIPNIVLDSYLQDGANNMHNPCQLGAGYLDLQPSEFSDGYNEYDIGPGLLKKITYPTGGYTEFKYERNRYQDSLIYFAGGYRIKKIINQSSPSEVAIVRTFKYGENEDGLGKVRQPYRPADYITEQYVLWGAYSISRLRSWYSSPNSDPFFSSGAPICYTEVSEYVGDTINNKGKKKYYYHYQDPEIYRDSPLNGNGLIDTKSDWFSGTLIKEESYDKDGTLLLKKSYEYEKYSDLIWTYDVFHNYRVRNGFSTMDFQTGTDNGALFGQEPAAFFNYYYGDAYSVYHSNYFIGSSELKSTATETYLSNGIIKDSTFYVYNGNRLASVITDNAGTADEVVTKLIYPDEYSSSSNVPGINALKSAFMIGVPVEVYKLKNNKVIESNLRTFQTSGQVIAPYENWKLQSTNPLPESVVDNASVFVASNLSNLKDDQYHSSPEEKMTYNSMGNITQMLDKDGRVISYLWGYNGRYPIAKIENAEYSTIESLLGGTSAVSSFASIAYPNQSQIDNFVLPLRNNLPNTTMITTYTYKPLVGMTSMTDPKGQKTTYEYDSSQRLQSVKDHNGNILKNYEYHYKP